MRKILLIVFLSITILQGQLFIELTELSPEINEINYEESSDDIEILLIQLRDFPYENNAIISINFPEVTKRHIRISDEIQTIINSYSSSFYDPISRKNVINATNSSLWYNFDVTTSDIIEIDPFFYSNYSFLNSVPFYFDGENLLEMNYPTEENQQYELTVTREDEIHSIIREDVGNSLYPQFYPIGNNKILIVNGAFIGGNDAAWDYDSFILDYKTEEIIDNNSQPIIGIGANCYITTNYDNYGLFIYNYEGRLIYSEDNYNLCSILENENGIVDIGSFNILKLYDMRFLVYELYYMYTSYSFKDIFIIDLKTSKVYVSDRYDFDFLGFSR